ncbi:MerR family transcriptional regulator [Priestia aryabhattai]|uniref:MerR family transcriptional regulator n=1 Tax=Priestia aryabhattai TaxID=412384 RepID=A0ABD7X2U2_PRIAR|nr:MerR family transcriptional regulator [Priestia aryabhattai]WEA46079.1 MerR family transcriptional regulator [Priestia aryabhattai]
MTKNQPYLDEKVMTIKIVTEMTGLSVRQVRYYEERELIFPKRNSSGTRMYSFSDIERLMDIAEKIEDSVRTREMRKDLF